MKRVYSNKIPSKIEKDNSGYYLYRWNIQNKILNITVIPIMK